MSRSQRQCEVTPGKSSASCGLPPLCVLGEGAVLCLVQTLQGSRMGKGTWEVRLINNRSNQRGIPLPRPHFRTKAFVPKLWAAEDTWLADDWLVDVKDLGFSCT